MPSEKPPRRLRERLALEFDRCIHCHHVVALDVPRECVDRLPLRRMPLRNVGAVKQHGVIAREDVRRVVEHTQMFAADLGVSGVDVDHVDLAGAQRVVGNAVVEACRGLRQFVALHNRRPAIGAAEKFVREAKPQRRMRGEVGQRADVFALGIGFAHGQRVGVFKAERHAGRQAHRRKAAVDVGQQRGLIGIGCLVGGQVEDFSGDSAEVIRIDVDAAVPERGKDDGGVAQARYVFGGAARVCGLREDFA